MNIPNTHPVLNLQSAVLYLSDRCDGAASEDGAGFNKFDADFGYQLATQIRGTGKLSYRQTISAHKLVRKYRKQLEAGAIVLPDLDDLIDALEAEIEEPIVPVVMNPWADSPWKDGLSEQQQEAFNQIHEWFFESDRTSSKFMLKGYSGTGKSFSTQRIIHSLRELSQEKGGRLRVALCAPTHKATKVLKSFAHKAGLYDVAITTLHSLLHVTPGEFDSQGRQKLIPNKFSTSAHYNEFGLVVVDESSMIGLDLLNFIPADIPTIFLGDPAQLPPVDPEEDGDPKLSPVFEVQPQYELTQVMRYDGEIAFLATDIRNNLDCQYPPRITSSGNLEKLSVTEWEVAMLKAFTQLSVNGGDPDSVRVLAFTNKRVEDLNRMVRAAMQFGVTDKYVADERLVAKEPIFKLPTIKEWKKYCEVNGKNFDLQWMPQDPEDAPILMQTCEECVVQSTERVLVTKRAQLMDVPLEVDCYLLKVESDLGVEFKVTAIAAEKGSPEMSLITAWFGEFRQRILNLHSDDEKKISTQKLRAKHWKDFCRILQELNLSVKGKVVIDRLQYAYALTTHQAQGSTFETVFADFNNMFACRHPKTRNQLRYVALTRAAKKAVVLSR